MVRSVVKTLLAFVLALSPLVFAAPEALPCRHPIALQLSDDGSSLYAANERRGTISKIDLRTWNLRGETAVAQRLSAFRKWPGRSHFAVLDPLKHALILVRLDDDRSGWIADAPTASHPVALEFSADGERAFVACQWARRCQVFRIDGPTNDTAAPRLHLESEIALPFEPFRQVLLPEANKLIVSEAFGGRVAVVDVATARVESVRRLNGHNIRALVLDPTRKQVLLTHQILDSYSPTMRGDVQWGFLMSNNLRAIPVSGLLDPNADLNTVSELIPIGDSGDPAGDPEALAVLPDGRIAVALGGVGELAFLDLKQRAEVRIGVGKRPLALLPHDGGRRLFVAAAFSDTVSDVDIATTHFRRLRIGEDHAISEAARGEHLFYDAQLSFRGWISCHSCHTDGHSNGLLNDNEADGSVGAPKRIASLLGVAETAPWAWNGSRHDLLEQVERSISMTMHGNATREEAAAITAFLRTLQPPQVKETAASSESERVSHGKALFGELRCTRCHESPVFTSSDVYDVGLVDERGLSKFNPPSLRGVQFRDRLFHDNRAGSIEEVLTKYRHQLRNELSAAEVEALAAYLRSL